MLSKAIRTYKIDGNPQADILYLLFEKWASEVSRLERIKEAAEKAMSFLIQNRYSEADELRDALKAAEEE